MKRSKYLVSVSITLSLILVLIFATPVSALEVRINGLHPRVLGENIHFSLTIYTKNRELVPIEHVDLEIYNENGDHRLYLICENLPLYENTKPYASDGWTIEVEALPQNKWGYGYGYLQAEWEGYGYFGYYGYGYGGFQPNPKAKPSYPTPTFIKYEITWDPEPTLTAGDYVIKATIYANGEKFIKTRTDKYK